MQLNVERGAPMTGKSTRLLKIHREACRAEDKILRGTHYTPAALEQRVRQYISLGATVICIDECSEQQIERLERLKGDLPGDLRIHAVVAN